MVTFNLAQPVFISIPCTKGMGDAFFCKLQENPTNNTNISHNVVKSHASSEYCTETWIFVKGNCYKPIPVNSGSHIFKLHSLCNKINSTTISYNDHLLVLDSIMLQLSNLHMYCLTKTQQDVMP